MATKSESCGTATRARAGSSVLDATCQPSSRTDGWSIGLRLVVSPVDEREHGELARGTLSGGAS